MSHKNIKAVVVDSPPTLGHHQRRSAASGQLSNSWELSSCLPWKQKDNTSTIFRAADRRWLKKKRKKVCGVQRRLAAVLFQSILTFAMTVWLGSVSAEEERRPNEVVRVASTITGCELPSPTRVSQAAEEERPGDFKGPFPSS